jgi:CRP-like cAMP-binding protein
VLEISTQVKHAQHFITMLLPIIVQGATDAHEFFVLEIGTCDVFVTRPGDLTPKKVKTYGPGSAFGELALLYTAPRAATVTTTSPCKVSPAT